MGVGRQQQQRHMGIPRIGAYLSEQYHPRLEVPGSSELLPTEIVHNLLMLLFVCPTQIKNKAKGIGENLVFGNEIHKLNWGRQLIICHFAQNNLQLQIRVVVILRD